MVSAVGGLSGGIGTGGSPSGVRVTTGVPIGTALPPARRTGVGRGQPPSPSATTANPATENAVRQTVTATILLQHHVRCHMDWKGVPRRPSCWARTLCAGRAAKMTFSKGRRQKAEGRRQKAEGRRQKAEGRRQKAEGRRQKAEGGGQKAEGRGRKAKGRRRKAEGGRQRAEGGRQKAEGRRQKAEGRRQKAEGRRQKAEGRRQKAESTFEDLFAAYCFVPTAFCLLPIVLPWRRGESNPRPKSFASESLHAYRVRFLHSPTTLRNVQERAAS